MRTAIWPLQTALYQRLSNDPELTAILPGGIYDGKLPAGDVALPYMIFGDDTVSDYSSKTFDGEEITKMIHVWSEYEGRKEAVNIMDIALQSITASPLNVTGFTFDDCRREFLEVFEDEDNYHGVMRLRFKITKGG